MRSSNEEDSIFPTNIVLNLEKGKRGMRAIFERAKQEDATRRRSPEVRRRPYTP